MGAFALGAGFFRSGEKARAVVARKAQVREGRRQADTLAEGVHRRRLLRGGIGQGKSGEDAEGHLLTVVKAVRLRQGGQAVVNAVGARKAAAFKADA